MTKQNWSAYPQLKMQTKLYESQGQVHRPERVNQCTCPYDPTKGILILSIKITK